MCAGKRSVKVVQFWKKRNHNRDGCSVSNLYGIKKHFLRSQRKRPMFWKKKRRDWRMRFEWNRVSLSIRRNAQFLFAGQIRFASCRSSYNRAHISTCRFHQTATNQTVHRKASRGTSRGKEGCQAQAQANESLKMVKMNRTQDGSLAHWFFEAALWYSQQQLLQKKRKQTNKKKKSATCCNDCLWFRQRRKICLFLHSHYASTPKQSKTKKRTKTKKKKEKKKKKKKKRKKNTSKWKIRLKSWRNHINQKQSKGVMNHVLRVQNESSLSFKWMKVEPTNGVKLKQESSSVPFQLAGFEENRFCLFFLWSTCATESGFCTENKVLDIFQQANKWDC